MAACGRFRDRRRGLIQDGAIDRGPRRAKKRLIATVPNSDFGLSPFASSTSTFSNRNKISLSAFRRAPQRGSQHKNQQSNFDFRVSIFEPRVSHPGSRCALCANLSQLNLARFAAAERIQLLCAA